MMTMSPERSSGTRTFSTYVSKARRLIGPSSTKGAIMPRKVNPATKVDVFQWPYGRPMGRRWRIGSTSVRPKHDSALKVAALEIAHPPIPRSSLRSQFTTSAPNFATEPQKQPCPRTAAPHHADTQAAKRFLGKALRGLKE